MLTPNIEDSNKLRKTSAHWLIAGHPSSNPRLVAQRFSGEVTGLELPEGGRDWDGYLIGIDAVALVVSAKTGISKEMISFWSYIAERNYPRLIIVNGLEFSETDFDDIVLIANRVLEQVSTPFLVLHDELGEPNGLISLYDLQVHDYSNNHLKKYSADEELTALVSEFKSEYEDQFSEFEEDGFAAGMFVPALPIGTERKFGLEEIQLYLDKITKH